MKLKTYIVNLERSTVRKQYMEDLLKPYSFLDVEFIKAVDGRQLSDNERDALFDYSKSLKLYGRKLNPGEVGCTLSHRHIYERVSKGDEPYVLVLEDDIKIMRDLNEINLGEVDSVLNVPFPRVLMLSGDYVYYKKKPIARIYSALGTYAYMVNKAGAELLSTKVPPCCVADDWLFYKRKGLKMYAIYPYMIDANVNMDLLGSEINQETWGINRSKMSIKENGFRAIAGLILKFFKRIDHFEYKTFIYQNAIYPIKLKRRK